MGLSQDKPPPENIAGDATQKSKGGQRLVPGALDRTEAPRLHGRQAGLERTEPRAPGPHFQHG
eukprot:4027024-Pyramimonas_sp.AAC.1